MILNGLPWKQTEIILSFLRLHPSTSFLTLLLTLMATAFLLSEVDDEEVDIKLDNAKAGEAYTSVKLDNATLNTYYAYSPIAYTAAGLPEGLAFEGGVITGTAAAAGEYTVTITAAAEGYAPASIELPLTVE